MVSLDVGTLRRILGVTRNELGHFLGVTESRIARWESDRIATEPSGMQAALLRSLWTAVLQHPPTTVARVIRDSA